MLYGRSSRDPALDVRPMPSLPHQALEHRTQLGGAPERLSQSVQIVLIKDQRRALETSPMVVITKPDLTRSGRRALLKFKELNRGPMVLADDLNLFSNYSGAPMQRKCPGLAFRPLGSS